MPYIFNLYKAIINIDIGIIVIYTCKNSCNKNICVEEMCYIQRSGEKVLDLNKKFIETPMNSIPEEKNTSNMNTANSNQKKKDDEDDDDDDGWVEVKKKKK